jgi:hypothetical protein
MRLGSGDFDRLARDARGLNEQSKSYIAEALESLRQENDPIATLRLLVALSGSPYARRHDQMEALDGVGRWLEERLRRDPGVAIERLRLELGWLRRMVIVNHSQPAQDRRSHDKSRGPAQPRGPAKPHGSSKPQSAAFGHDLAQLGRRRQVALGDQAQAESRAAAPASATKPGGMAPAPSLPDVFRVTFADVNALREARKNAKKRAKNDRPAKDRLLTLRPVDPAQAGLAGDLHCWLLGTDGMQAVLAAMDAHDGILPALYVRRSDIVDADGKRVVRRVTLTPSQPENTP